MFFINKTKKLNLIIKKFFTYIISEFDNYTEELVNDYKPEELKKCIYICALNTIDEYILKKKNNRSILLSTYNMVDLFEENLILQQFERKKLAINYNETTLKILEYFETIIQSETLYNDDAIKNINTIITSTK